MNRFNKNQQINEEDRDDIECWEQQKQEYLEENPTQTELFVEVQNATVMMTKTVMMERSYLSLGCLLGAGSNK